MIRAILLDKDGTLTNFRATWETWLPDLLRELAQATGTAPEALGEAIGFEWSTGRVRPHALFVTGTGWDCATAMAPLTDWPASQLEDWLAPRAMAVPQVAVTPMGPLLSGLRARGLALGVLTNDGEAEARHHLAEMGALEHLSDVIGYDSGYGAKPDPGGALAFAARCGVDPSEVALVGDGVSDMRAARAAGMEAIGVLTGALDRAALADHADVVLADVTALPEWLDDRVGPSGAPGQADRA